ncbi:MAG: hypothetical protein ACJ746_31465 [Bryobacteraceae bacterium]
MTRCPSISILLLVLSLAAFRLNPALAQSPANQLPIDPALATTRFIAAPLAPSHAASQDPAVSKRLLGVIPNFRADQYHEQYIPLSTAQKFEIARHDSFDWPNYLLLVGYAAQTQMSSEAGHHKNVGVGFRDSYVRSVADQVAGSYITEAILPSLLHEDPRFFRLGSGTFRHRAFHATSAVMINRRDNGTRGFAYSEMLGNAGSVALSNLYYSEDRSASNALERYSMTIGNDMISNLLTEFWPDIRRRLTRIHR